MVRLLVVFPVSVALAACASQDAVVVERPEVAWDALWPDLARPDAGSFGGDGAFPARRPDPAGLDRLREAEQLWRARDDAAFARERAELAADPVLAFWLARMLVRDALFRRENAPAEAAAMVGAPPWQRPTDELVAMGAAAAPCVVLDLLRQRSVDHRDFAAEILHAMGPAALPAWERTFDVVDPLVRRYAVNAISGWPAAEGGGADRAFALLVQATRDSDFGVRAEAWRGIGMAGPDQGGRLRAALAAESDPFVRRAIVGGLGHQADLDSAETIVTFLEQAIRDGDLDGIEAAQRAMMRFAKRAEPDSPAGWRRWLDTRRQERG